MKVRVLRCSYCKKLQVPPAYFCRSCRSEGLEETEMPGEGTLYTYSTVHVPLASLEKEAPYTVVIVELGEGCRVTGRLVNPLPHRLAVGAQVKLVEIRDGVCFFDFR
ncbi:MAG TPA: OB-fold domain-containing protein [Thermodesulfobacteriota bacterium]|nr:OB-fold domain-containing protein [Thermodesulfobacteriota bacterium]